MDATDRFSPSLYYWKKVVQRRDVRAFRTSAATPIRAMSLYHWESSAKAHHKKVKKTGTVVFHPDEAVDLSFNRLLKEHVLEKEQRNDSSVPKGSGPKAPLMTSATVKRLQDTMHFTGLLPCQAQCYRGIFNGRDVILHSRTGSGKTLAYALPLIERHLIVERGRMEVRGPFLLIFVFSNDLAVQTKGVLRRIYPSLNIGVAGFDDTTVGTTYDILIGTVRKLDEAIRGKKVAAAATALEENEKEEVEKVLSTMSPKRPRKEAPGPMRKKGRTEEGPAEAEEADINESDDDVAGAAIEDSRGDVCVESVRVIVIDEVDTTLGPRFSNVGRRMKNLLKFIRRANGSLTEGLLTDFRAHHYVLCGATIPNWVIKAGFLGIKKYYYQLVPPGGDKLPSTLTCYQLTCPADKRVEMAVTLLTDKKNGLGRTVVFGTNRQVMSLESSLKAAQQAAVQSIPAGKKQKKDTSSTFLTVRTLTASRDELERVEAMMDYESKVADVLLCTDIAARGLDFSEVHTVLMLSVPRGNMAAETFVHRAGRTARVDRVGQCFLMCDKTEADIVDAIVKSSHVVFQKYVPSSVGGAARSPASSVTRFQLTVKNPFKRTRPDAVVPSARQVLERQLGEALMPLVRDPQEESESTEVLTFAVDVSRAHEVKQKLWKYSLKELSD